MAAGGAKSTPQTAETRSTKLQLQLQRTQSYHWTSASTNKDQCVQLLVWTATWWRRPPLLASGFTVLGPTAWPSRHDPAGSDAPSCVQGARLRVVRGLLDPRLALLGGGHMRLQSTIDKQAPPGAQAKKSGCRMCAWAQTKKAPACGGHREEHPAGGNRSGVLQRARAHPPWAHEVLPAAPARLRRGVRAAPRPRRAIQSSSSAGTRGTRHGAPGGTGNLVACPLAGGVSSWLGWVTARRRGGRA
jgi:hypothetical protein